MSAEVLLSNINIMRNPRSVTPAPLSLQCEAVCPDGSSSRRFSLLSQHLPSLPEGSPDLNGLTRIISPVFLPSEVGKSEIVELVGSPSNTRRGQLVKSGLERGRKSEETARLPNLNKRETFKENVQPSSPKSNLRLRKHNQLTRTFSQPVISTSESFPRINNWDSLPRTHSLDEDHSAEIRRHIQKEDMEYDLFSTKAVILEHYLNSQNVA